MSDREECAAFFHRVLREEGHEGWTLEWYPDDSDEGYCWLGSRKINIGPKGPPTQVRYLMLHEIAHIEPDPPHGNKHHVAFWRRLRRLLDQYLDGAELSSSDTHLCDLYAGAKT